MATATLLVLTLMFSPVQVGQSAETLFNLTCQSAVGVIGQTTNISCSIETQTGSIDINTAVLTRFRENKPCFTFQPYENRVTGDSRFKVESLPSLQLHNTEISDEGGYRYYIRTNLGKVNAEFRINVTAKYSPPIMTSEPTEIKSGGDADLYCRASGGYPAGTIHWFDKSNTNRTENAKLQITQGHDGLFTLSSKLSFRSIDTNWGHFRCVVLNYRYEEEGASTPAQGRGGDGGITTPTDSTTKPIIAAVIVIGSLIAGVLFVLLFRRRRSHHMRRASCVPILSDPVGEPEQEQALNKPVYKKADDVEEKIDV